MPIELEPLKENDQFGLEDDDDEDSKYCVRRAVYSQDIFDDKHPQAEQQEKTFKQHIHQCGQSCFPCCIGPKKGLKKCCQMTLSLIPCVAWLRKYKLKEYLISDILAGMTVAILLIPQAMAYSQLASLPPIHGLYTGFFSMLVYFIFGTSKQINVAPVAIICLMTGAVVDTYGGSVPGYLLTYSSLSENPEGNGTATNLTTISTNLTEVPTGNLTGLPPEPVQAPIPVITGDVMVASAVSLVAGFVQVGMSVLHLGFITLYLSDPLIEGFMTGAVLHIMVSQVKRILGLSITKYQGPLKLVKSIIEICRKLPETKIPELIVGLSSMLVLYLVKECINKRYKKKMKIPIPIDFILVVVVTGFSAAFDFNGKFDIDILEYIPTGIPPPSMPPASLIGTVAVDGLVIAIIAFALTISIAKNYGKKHGYQTDPNQELLALGVDSIVCSMFQGFASAASFSRSILQDSLGGKTQIAGVIAALLLLIILLALGPLLEALPNAVLAAIILIALKNTLDNYKEPMKLWRESRTDCFVWLVTYLSVVFLEVHTGLIAGVVFSMLCVIVRTQYSHAVLLGRIPTTNLYCDKSTYPDAETIPGVQIFRFESCLYYANAEFFKTKLYKMTDMDPKLVKIKRNKLLKKASTTGNAGKMGMSPTQDQPLSAINETSNAILNNEKGDTPNNAKEDDTMYLSTKYVIIDCSLICMIDHPGMMALKQVINDYAEIGVMTFLTHCHERLISTLDEMKFFDKMSKSHLFPTNHDAVLCCKVDV